MMLMSQRLCMDAPSMGDAELFSKWLNSPTVVKYSELRHQKHSPESQRHYWTFQKPEIYYVIHIGDKPENPLGAISANIDFNNVANVSILIGKMYEWGRGYGFEAWECFCNYLIAEKKVRKIEAGCMAPNKGMNNICLKYGMRLEAVISKHFILDGKPTDMYLYGKIAR